MWRKRGDSNLWYAFTYVAFPRRCLKPLGHSSISDRSGVRPRRCLFPARVFAACVRRSKRSTGAFCPCRDRVSPTRTTLHVRISPVFCGAPNTIRTCNLSLRRGLLYPLSYRGLSLRVAEVQGFEPWEDFHPRRFSRPVHSTTLPNLRNRIGHPFCVRKTINIQDEKYCIRFFLKRCRPPLAGCPCPGLINLWRTRKVTLKWCGHS